MNSIKTLKVSSILIMLLGSIHLAATPMVFALFNSPADTDLSSIYMFVMVGIAVLFAGGLQYYLVPKIVGNSVFVKIFIGSVIFVGIMGIGAAITLTKNPFAYISLIVAITEVIALRSFLNKRTNE
jgi:peptidoglycan/LPS O-acetylase OafA/YrhL